MKLKLPKWALGLGSLLACGATALSLSAQTFDTPPSDFPLTPASSTGLMILPPIPTTLNSGNFDSSVVSAVTGAQLNDVVVLGVPSLDEQAPSLTHRIWTIVHDSGTNTRSLVQTDPSDIVITSEEEVFYIEPSSVQILDLTGDGQNDLALIDSDFLLRGTVNTAGLKFEKSGIGNPAKVIGIPGQASAPFFATSLNLLGQQGPDASIPGSFLSEVSQPSLAVGDFDGDGVSDLAFYDFIVEGMETSDLAAVLKNNGTVGTLPRTDTSLNIPADVGGQNGGYNVISADINGDGIADLAMTFDLDNIATSGPDRLLAFLGNGDGTFNPEPVVNVVINDDGELHGLAVGDFDGNSFLDFAVSSAATDSAIGSDLEVVLCNPGTPAACSVNTVALENTFATNLAAGDFDSDGLDDLAIGEIVCPGDCTGLDQFVGNVGVYLNQGSSFSTTPDQALLLGGTEDRQWVNQVVSQDIDGCGGPDLAYTGFEFPEITPTQILQNKLSEFQSSVKLGVTVQSQFASVAFNANEAPVADAGEGTLTPGGTLVGGEPTCSDPSDDTMAILWEVVSGTATISNPTVANPLITNASAGAVLRVTCTDACGLSDSDTVTVVGPTLLEGSGIGCSLGLAPDAGLSASWFFSLLGFLPMLALRRRR